MKKFFYQNGRKVICGTQNGVVLLYSWGFFKDCRFVLFLFNVRFSGKVKNILDFVKLPLDNLTTIVK